MILPQIIAFTGHAGAGKTTAADWIKESFPDYQEFSFAWEIKRIATFYLNWDGKKDARGRKLLQDIGTAGRAYKKDMWLRYMHPDIPIVIDDVRYLNEAAHIRAYHGKIIRITADNLQRMEHESEVEQDQIAVDYTIHNDKQGSLEARLKDIFNAY